MADLLAVRKAIKAKKPQFKRQDTTHRPNLGTTGWRKPKGLHSKMRHNKKGHRSCVNVGWGSPAAVEGTHPGGLMPVIVCSIADLEGLAPKTHGAVIGAGVGDRLKVALVDALMKKSITILNMKDPKGFAAQVAARLKARKDARLAKSTTKKEEPLAKKPEVKKELSEEEKKEAARKEAEKVMIQKER